MFLIFVCRPGVPARDGRIIIYALCLRDSFSDNHDVIAADGCLADISGRSVGQALSRRVLDS
jgi:hypothetical protein